MKGLTGIHVVILLVVILGSASAQETVDCDVSLHRWRIAAPGYASSGLLLLVTLPDGAWRAAAALDPVGPRDLLAEGGEGWTFVGVPEGGVWWGLWRDASERLEPEVATLAERCVGLLVDGEGIPYRAAIDGDRPKRLSARSAERAAGRGAAAETWWVSGGEDGVRIRSRRRPVTVSAPLATRRSLPVNPDDILVPGWPLGELLDLPDED